MKASQFLFSTFRQSDAEIVSHQFMLRAGMIQFQAKGIYAWLPMGYRVLEKISNIVRQEQNRIGAQEMLAPTLQPARLWQESGRYNDYGDELLRFPDGHEELFYGPTAEEVFTDVVRRHVQSYRQLPQCLYNIQWKFRNEIRPRFGVMRGREFLMKDAYSFDLDAAGARLSYQNMFEAYMKTFARLGLVAIPVRAETGPIGGDLSHEFHILADTGESELFCQVDLLEKSLDCQKNRRPYVFQEFQKYYAAADKKHDPLASSSLNLVTRRGIEVGHIFYFGTKYSKAMNAKVLDANMNTVFLEMGSYGIGISRLVGAIIQASHDEKGIIWPASVAPFLFSLGTIGPSIQESDIRDVYHQLLTQFPGEVFWYDLERRPGEMFSDLDLVGFPYQIFLGKRWEKEKILELKIRSSGETLFLDMPSLMHWAERTLHPLLKDW